MRTLHYPLQLVRSFLLIILTLIIVIIFCVSMILGIFLITIFYKYRDTERFGNIRDGLWQPYEVFRQMFNKIWNWNTN